MIPWSEPDVGFRPRTVDDLPLLYDWLGRDHVRVSGTRSEATTSTAAEYLDPIEVAILPTSARSSRAARRSE